MAGNPMLLTLLIHVLQTVDGGQVLSKQRVPAPFGLKEVDQRLFNSIGCAFDPEALCCLCS